MTDTPLIQNATLETFDEIVIQGSHTQPILVDFWADWCNPCKALMPILQKLVEEFTGQIRLAKVDTEDQKELGSQQGIRSLPTVRLYYRGQVVDEFMGLLPEAEVRAFIEKNLPNATDQLITEIQTSLQQGDMEQATQLCEQALGSAPDDPRVKLAAAQISAVSGDLEKATAMLDALPLEEQDRPLTVALRAQIEFDSVSKAAPPASELESLLETEPNNSQARYQLAAHQVMQQQYESALENLLTLMQQDRQYEDDAARKGMLLIFSVLGADNPLVSRYRSRLFNALH